MAKDLRNIIREAFTIAYYKHKTKNLFENVESLKSTMSSSDINKAEHAFREIKGNLNMAAKYAWTPQGSVNGELNTSQWNLLAEMIFENMDSENRRKAFMVMYSDKNPALVNTIKGKLMGIKGTFVTEEEAMQAMENAWNQIFIGEKYKNKEDIKRGFSDAEKEYVPKDKSNFGAYLITRLLNASLNSLRDSFNSEKTQSLDAPVAATGKPRDVSDSGDDFGSDALEDPETHDVVGSSNLLDEPDTEERETTILPGEESEEDTDEKSTETLGQKIAGSESDDSSPAEREAKRMVSILVESLHEAIDDFRKYVKVTPAQEKGLSALEKVLATGESPDKDSTNSILDLKKNKKFIITINRYLAENGFVNSRGKVESFINIKIKYLARLVKFLQTGDLSLLKGLDESKIWFLEDVLFEDFIKYNMDKVMENVYKRLSPRLNN